MNQEIKKQPGFTLVELMLAMSFVAVLLLAIAMLIMQIGSTYVKGMTVKDVNQSGRALSEDIRRTVATAGSLDLASDFVRIPNATNPTSGRLCLGGNTYIWNTAVELHTGATNKFSNKDLTKHALKSDENVPHLVKVADPEKRYCQKNSSGGPAFANIRDADKAKTRELLQVGDRTLVLYKFNIVRSGSAGGVGDENIYRVTFTVGTDDITLVDGVNPIGADRIKCKPGLNSNYCTVQEFSLVIRTGAVYEGGS